MRELKFNLNIGDGTTGILLNTNPSEFYAKSYITEDVVNNFRTLPGIKSKTKIATTSFTNILKESSCDFSALNQTVSSFEIEVQPLSALAEICRFDIEASYLSLSMAQGSGASYEVQPFMNFYWEQMANEIQEEIEVIRWQGRLGSTASGYTGDFTFKAQADGYEKLLSSDGTVLKVTGTVSTVDNVLAELQKVYLKLATDAPDVVAKTADLRFHVSSNVAANYRLAVAKANTLSYVTKNLDFNFLDIKLVVAQGASANKMVLALKDDLIYAFDGEGDKTALKAVNLEESVAEPKLRTRVNLKVGFSYTNPTQIVYYSI